jgi:uncharacterized Zn finger protein
MCEPSMPLVASRRVARRLLHSREARGYAEAGACSSMVRADRS